METIQGRWNNGNESEFKSYYVVWKLGFSSIIFFCPAGFKSYYVVWKPCDNCNEKIQEEGFKSYYVVWKLYFSASARKNK